MDGGAAQAKVIQFKENKQTLPSGGNSANFLERIQAHTEEELRNNENLNDAKERFNQKINNTVGLQSSTVSNNLCSVLYCTLH